jgi:hypothetical protein
VEGWIHFITQDKIDENNPGTSIANLLLRLIGERQSDTNLEVWDAIRLWKDIRAVLPGRETWIDLFDTQVLTEDIQPDGTTEYSSDAVLLDRLSKQYFSEKKIEKEGLSVIVFNSTEHSGLGKRAARTIENLGAKVIGVRDISEFYPDSVITTSKEFEDSLTLEKIKQIFQVNKQELNGVGDERADLVLILGEEYWKSITEFFD